MGLPEDLDLIDKLTRQLQIEWDKFFSGAERKPPNRLKDQLEGLIRQYAYQEIRNNADRFRYQSLSARYSSFNDLWNKRMLAREEGRPLGIHTHVPPPAPAKAAAATTPSKAAGPARAPALDEYRIQSPDSDSLAVSALYEQFLTARRAAGETAAVQLDSFRKLIGQQTTRIRAERGAQAVDFRIETKDGKVTLKAKPVK